VGPFTGEESNLPIQSPKHRTDLWLSPTAGCATSYCGKDFSRTPQKKSFQRNTDKAIIIAAVVGDSKINRISSP